MSIRLLTSAKDLDAYDQWVKSHPQGSLWQSLEWKKYQESMGREVRVYGDVRSQMSDFSATALVVIDRTVGGLSTWDIPRGPLTDVRYPHSDISTFLKTLYDDARKNRCISLYVSPASMLTSEICHLTSSSRHQQPEASRILDLTLSDDQLLAQMHQKGRYNINVARKNGVVVERSKDIDAYYALAQKTGKRDAFGIPSKKQLCAFLEHLPGSFLLLAYSSHENEKSGVISDSRLKTQDSKPIAGLIGVTWNGTGIYYYGASDYEHRALMAPYLLQWEAIQLCKKAGCTHYDLLGIAPTQTHESLEPRASSDKTLGAGGRGQEAAVHPWAGISDFKAKFGGTIISYPPEQEITLRPMVKWVLGMKRKLLG